MRIHAQNTNKVLPNFSFKREDTYKAIFQINNFLQGELCRETYEFKNTAI